MKRKFLILLFLLICGSGYFERGHAQEKPHFMFKFMKTDEYNMVRQRIFFWAPDTAVSYVLGYFGNPQDVVNNTQPSSPILLGTKLNPKLQYFYGPDVKSITKAYTTYLISDSSEAEVIAMGINTANVKDYRYRVIENDSVEVIPWTIPQLEQKHGAAAPYAFIGKFRAPGKQLLVEVQNIKHYNIRDGVLFDWHVNLKPVVTQIELTGAGDWFNLSYLKKNKGYATKFLEGTNIPIDFKFPADSINKMRFALKQHETAPYNIDLIYKGKGREVKTNLAFYMLTDYFALGSKEFKQPGKYELIITLPGSNAEDQVIRIPFEVKPPPLIEKKVSIKQIIPYAIAALSGVAILFFLYRRQSRAKLRRVAQEKQVVALQLRSIRAQLNPHFMFNALTSIQSLMNKNDVSGANFYLSKFADLTRQVLDSSNEDLLSLEDEMKVLDDYLQMEQLRFHFKYELQVDESLNQANIEMPAMLLQPFAENAIKHGIAGLNEDGVISVAVNGEGSSLVLMVKDNGAGFVRQPDAMGYGIKLSEERVALLNQIYKDQSVTLDINTGPQGTIVTIRLTNWIS